MINPWKTLGVHRKSSDAEIRDAYYDLARKHHPDAGGDKDKFVTINYAYELIEDAYARRDFFQLHGKKDCTECKGTGVKAKTKSLTKKEYTACKGCGGAGIIIRENTNEQQSIELRGTSGAGRKGSNKRRKS